MISVNTDFVNVAKALAHTPIAKLVCTDGQTTATFAKNELQSFSVERSACVSSTFTLGSTVAGTFTGTLLTSALQNAGFATLNNLQVTAYLGYVVNGIETYIQEGVFYLDDSETTDKGLFTDIKGYDVFMSKGLDTTIDENFVDTFSVSITPYAAFAELATVYTGTYTFDYSAVPNTGDTPVFVDFDMTLRDVLSRLAVAAGCNLIASPTGAIKCTYPTLESATIPAALTFGTSDYKSCDIDGRDQTYISYIGCQVEGEEGTEDVQYPLASVIESLAPDSVGIRFDNTFFTNSEALQTVYERFMPYTYSGLNIRNLHYQGHNLELRGFPYIEPMDAVSLTRRKTNGTTETFVLVPFTVVHAYNGAIKTSLTATTIQQEQTAQSSTTARVNNTIKNVTESVIELGNQLHAVYAVCDTANTIAAKQVNISGFNLYPGVAVTVKFLSDNVAGSPTLNVSNTGAFPLYANNVQMSYPSPYAWKADQLVSFVFADNPNRWVMVGANPANFCGFVSDGNGGKVLQISTDATASGFHTDIGADNIALKQGSDSLLKIEANQITIGKTVDRQLVMSNTGVAINDGDTKITLANAALTLETGGSTASKTTINSSEMNTPIVNHQQALFTNTVSPFTYIIQHRNNGHLTFKGYSSVSS